MCDAAREAVGLGRVLSAELEPRPRLRAARYSARKEEPLPQPDEPLRLPAGARALQAFAVVLDAASGLFAPALAARAGAETLLFAADGEILARAPAADAVHIADGPLLVAVAADAVHVRGRALAADPWRSAAVVDVSAALPGPGWRLLACVGEAECAQPHLLLGAGGGGDWRCWWPPAALDAPCEYVPAPARAAASAVAVAPDSTADARFGPDWRRAPAALARIGDVFVGTRAGAVLQCRDGAVLRSVAGLGGAVERLLVATPALLAAAVGDQGVRLLGAADLCELRALEGCRLLGADDVCGHGAVAVVARRLDDGSLVLSDGESVRPDAAKRRASKKKKKKSRAKKAQPGLDRDAGLESVGRSLAARALSGAAVLAQREAQVQQLRSLAERTWQLAGFVAGSREAPPPACGCVDGLVTLCGEPTPPAAPEPRPMPARVELLSAAARVTNVGAEPLRGLTLAVVAPVATVARAGVCAELLPGDSVVLHFRAAQDPCEAAADTEVFAVAGGAVVGVATGGPAAGGGSSGGGGCGAVVGVAGGPAAGGGSSGGGGGEPEHTGMFAAARVVGGRADPGDVRSALELGGLPVAGELPPPPLPARLVLARGPRLWLLGAQPGDLAALLREAEAALPVGTELRRAPPPPAVVAAAERALAAESRLLSEAEATADTVRRYHALQRASDVAMGSWLECTG